MNRISIIVFSLTGEETALRLAADLKNHCREVTIDRKSRYLENSIGESTSMWAGKRFSDSDGIIFVGAAGIAVRSIAPYIVSKKTDPAILVIDECGKFVISLMSGHLGGANELTKLCSEILTAIPVITTATDLHGKFAVDVFAKKNACSILDLKAAKEVSAGILKGEPIGFYSEFPWEGELPEGLVWIQNPEEKDPSELPEIGIAVTIHRNRKPFSHTVRIIPKVVSLGMGCRKGKSYEELRPFAESLLTKHDLSLDSIRDLSSIDLKKEEEGLLSLSREWKIPFITYTAEELSRAPGEYAPSGFVTKITGVDNVCERSAVLSSEEGIVIQKKLADSGMTGSLAVRNWRIHF
ncbi:MAG: cobalt-precorrin 5A hydrolase [Eubacteriales bacterium]|nr:cobalt-precorrin 5A hydrolase [Eubacteriales bacterium]